MYSAGCTDVDDALSARQLPNGQLEVGVHIADVSHFVAQVRSQCGCTYAAVMMFKVHSAL